MYMKQSDLLKGLSKDFLKQVMEIAEKETHREGYLLFREGDSAGQLYILLKGRVNLTLGETSHTVYTVDHPGEVFGWSSLVGRKGYSASAECKEPTKLLKIRVENLEKLFEKDRVNENIFFRELAAGLGLRLIQSYKMISNRAEGVFSLSYGTSQVQESVVTVS
ncbi:MAG: cyclic nucleotide-binding domain-containing protein [Deltaproteobacteria bacterium]|nr:cyclic nucleotide-binding domain-containing protein [Deltaproteobacteria bacterium]